MWFPATTSTPPEATATNHRLYRGRPDGCPEGVFHFDDDNNTNGLFMGRLRA
jgi:hypothetical protein